MRRLPSCILHSQHTECALYTRTYLLVDTGLTVGARVSWLTLAYATLTQPMPTAWNLWKHKHTHTHTHTQVKTRTYTHIYCRPSCVARMVTHTLHRHYVRTYMHATQIQTNYVSTACTLTQTHICTPPHPSPPHTPTQTQALTSSSVAWHTSTSG